MKRIFQIIYFLIIVGIAGLLSGCQKIIDHWPKGHGHEKITCKIKKIVSDDDNYEVRYYYGPKELLDSIIITPEQGTANPSYTYLKYDESNRLIEYSQHYQRDLEATELHHYKYEGNKVVQDTLFSKTLGAATIVEDLEYDSHNRIVGITGIFWYDDRPSLIEPLEPRTYEYNNKGNISRVTGNGYSSEYPDYDEKVHPWNTDPILQFINRDYSKNNRLPGPTSYNEQGLPLTYPGDDSRSGSAFEYDCK